MWSNCFGGAANFLFFPHGPPDGVHILDFVLESTNLGVFSHNACRMREQLCQIDHSDRITWMPFGRFLVSVLPRVICLTLRLHLFQALADALRINRTIRVIYLERNQIGDEGIKVWCVERCGVSPGSCVRVDSGWVLLFIKGSHGKSPDLIEGFIIEPLTFSILFRSFHGLIGFWTVCLSTWFRYCSWTWKGW